MLAVVFLLTVIFTGSAFAKTDPCDGPAAAHNPHCNVEDTEDETADKSEDKGKSGDAPGKNKVVICHKPYTPAAKIKSIPPTALSGHLNHGDWLISVNPECPKEKATEDSSKPGPKPSPKPHLPPEEDKTLTPVVEIEPVEEIEQLQCNCCCVQTVTIEGDNYGNVVLVCGNDNEINVVNNDMEGFEVLLDEYLKDTSAGITREQADEIISLLADPIPVKNQYDEYRSNMIAMAQTEEIQARAKFFDVLPLLLLGLVVIFGVIVIGVTYVWLNASRYLEMEVTTTE